jgi:hypothetical protein
MLRLSFVQLGGLGLVVRRMCRSCPSLPFPSIVRPTDYHKDAEIKGPGDFITHNDALRQRRPRASAPTRNRVRGRGHHNDGATGISAGPSMLAEASDPSFFAPDEWGHAMGFETPLHNTPPGASSPFIDNNDEHQNPSTSSSLSSSPSPTSSSLASSCFDPSVALGPAGRLLTAELATVLTPRIIETTTAKKATVAVASTPRLRGTSSSSSSVYGTIAENTVTLPSTYIRDDRSTASSSPKRSYEQLLDSQKMHAEYGNTLHWGTSWKAFVKGSPPPRKQESPSPPKRRKRTSLPLKTERPDNSWAQTRQVLNSYPEFLAAPPIMSPLESTSGKFS